VTLPRFVVAAAQSFGVGCSADATSEQSAHFFGALDKVRVYRQTLDADAVQDLYKSATVMLRMPFDEPPGAQIFSAANGQRGPHTARVLARAATAIRPHLRRVRRRWPRRPERGAADGVVGADCTGAHPSRQ
jgi:hypothetical protein